MTEPQTTSSRKEGWIAPVGAVLAVYAASKPHLPGLVVSAVEGIGQRVGSLLTAGRKTAEEVFEKLPFGEKVRLYATVLRGWLAYRPDFSQYLAYIRASYKGHWTRSLREGVSELYAKLSTWGGSQDILYLSAFLLSEGSERLQNALISTWSQVRSPTLLLTSVKDNLQVKSLSTSVREKVRLFTSINEMSTELRASAVALQTKGRSFMKSAKEISSRTVFILYGSIDRSMEFSLRVLDERVVSRLSAPPREIGLRGEARLVDMERRLRAELTEFWREKKEIVKASHMYTTISATMQAGIKVYQRSSDSLAASELPEVIKAPIDSVLLFVGLGAVLTRFDKTVWTRLDMDADGVVTVGDMCKALSPKRVLTVMLNGYALALGWEHGPAVAE